jgi:glycosyltransferase involved in cell wall biosynthesis
VGLHPLLMNGAAIPALLRSHAIVRAPISIALVGTCPPRQCGIATFASDLADSIGASDATATISWAAIDQPWPSHEYGPEVRWRIEQGDPASYREAAEELNASDVDVVAIEHEFGLYGVWNDGFVDHLEPFLEVLRKPVVTTLHTVLPEPHPSHRRALHLIGERSAAVVVMTETAKRLLVQEYGVPESRVRVIPHGVPPMPPSNRDRAKAKLRLEGRTVIATFGLVDPRKGLEYAIRAMQAVAERHPEALYLILGRTHPEFVRASGESYRDELTTLVEALGLSEHVRFIDRYLDQEDIVGYLRATDVYVTPYLDPNQITSGTLAYALGAGRAIVSTPYLHAAEVLAEGRGILVGFRSEQALAEGVNRVLGDSALRSELERSAYDYGRHTAWPIIARRTLNLFREVAGRGSLALYGARAPYPVNDQRWPRPRGESESDGGPTRAGVAAVQRARPLTSDTRLESPR